MIVPICEDSQCRRVPGFFLEERIIICCRCSRQKGAQNGHAGSAAVVGFWGEPTSHIHEHTA